MCFSNTASKSFAASHFLNALSGPGCVECDNEPIDVILFPKESSQVYVPQATSQASPKSFAEPQLAWKPVSAACRRLGEHRFVSTLKSLGSGKASPSTKILP